MNVIITNKYKEMLMSLEIDVIKSMDGVFNVDDITTMFTNFYYDRMILDITSINNYQNFDNIRKLSISLDMSKIILLLDDSEICNDANFISNLISIGVYNFTRNIEGIKYLLNNPNSYKDVAHLHNVNTMPTQTPAVGAIITPTETVQKTIEVNITSTKIIGIKNLTDHSGATTLTYMLFNQLRPSYNICAFEVDKMDFSYFNGDPALMTTTKGELAVQLMKNNNKDVILIDLNNYEEESICTEVLYLIEPSILKLNKLMKRNAKVFENLKDKKIILNQSELNESDIKTFEYEAGIKVFYNLGNVNDREIPNPKIADLITQLGL